MKESKNRAEHFNYLYESKAVVFIMAFFLSIGAIAQDYSSAVGLRASYGGLVSYKHKLNSEYFAEGIFAIRWGGVEFTGLIERSQPAFDKGNMFWYYGGGMHLGIHGRDNTINPPDSENTKTYINLGADLIGGLEYVIPDSPLSISIDYKPSFHFTGERWFVGEGIGFNVRFLIY